MSSRSALSSSHQVPTNSPNAHEGTQEATVETNNVLSPPPVRSTDGGADKAAAPAKFHVTAENVAKNRLLQKVHKEPIGPSSYVKGFRLNNNCRACARKGASGNKDTGDGCFYCDACWGLRAPAHYSSSSSVSPAFAVPGMAAAAAPITSKEEEEEDTYVRNNTVVGGPSPLTPLASSPSSVAPHTNVPQANAPLIAGGTTSTTVPSPAAAVELVGFARQYFDELRRKQQQSPQPQPQPHQPNNDDSKAARRQQRVGGEKTFTTESATTARKQSQPPQDRQQQSNASNAGSNNNVRSASGRQSASNSAGTGPTVVGGSAERHKPHVSAEAVERNRAAQAVAARPAAPPTYEKGPRLNNNCRMCRKKGSVGHTDTGDRLFYCNACWEVRLANRQGVAALYGDPPISPTPSLLPPYGTSSASASPTLPVLAGAPPHHITNNPPTNIFMGASSSPASSAATATGGGGNASNGEGEIGGSFFNYNTIHNASMSIYAGGAHPATMGATPTLMATPRDLVGSPNASGRREREREKERGGHATMSSSFPQLQPPTAASASSASSSPKLQASLTHNPYGQQQQQQYRSSGGATAAVAGTSSAHSASLSALSAAMYAAPPNPNHQSNESIKGAQRDASNTKPHAVVGGSRGPSPLTAIGAGANRSGSSSSNASPTTAAVNSSVRAASGGGASAAAVIPPPPPVQTPLRPQQQRLLRRQSFDASASTSLSHSLPHPQHSPLMPPPPPPPTAALSASFASTGAASSAANATRVGQKASAAGPPQHLAPASRSEQLMTVTVGNISNGVGTGGTRRSLVRGEVIPAASTAAISGKANGSKSNGPLLFCVACSETNASQPLCRDAGNAQLYCEACWARGERRERRRLRDLFLAAQQAKKEEGAGERRGDGGNMSDSSSTASTTTSSVSTPMDKQRQQREAEATAIASAGGIGIIKNSASSARRDKSGDAKPVGEVAAGAGRVFGPSASSSRGTSEGNMLVAKQKGRQSSTNSAATNNNNQSSSSNNANSSSKRKPSSGIKKQKNNRKNSSKSSGGNNNSNSDSSNSALLGIVAALLLNQQQQQQQQQQLPATTAAMLSAPSRQYYNGTDSNNDGTDDYGDADSGSVVLATDEDGNTVRLRVCHSGVHHHHSDPHQLGGGANSNNGVGGGRPDSAFSFIELPTSAADIRGTTLDFGGGAGITDGAVNMSGSVPLQQQQPRSPHYSQQSNTFSVASNNHARLAPPPNRHSTARRLSQADSQNNNNNNNSISTISIPQTTTATATAIVTAANGKEGQGGGVSEKQKPQQRQRRAAAIAADSPKLMNASTTSSFIEKKRRNASLEARKGSRGNSDAEAETEAENNSDPDSDDSNGSGVSSTVGGCGYAAGGIVVSASSALPPQPQAATGSPPYLRPTPATPIIGDQQQQQLMGTLQPPLQSPGAVGGGFASATSSFASSSVASPHNNNNRPSSNATPAFFRCLTAGLSSGFASGGADNNNNNINTSTFNGAQSKLRNHNSAGGGSSPFYHRPPSGASLVSSAPSEEYRICPQSLQSDFANEGISRGALGLMGGSSHTTGRGTSATADVQRPIVLVSSTGRRLFIRPASPISTQQQQQFPNTNALRSSHPSPAPQQPQQQQQQQQATASNSSDNSAATTCTTALIAALLSNSGLGLGGAAGTDQLLSALAAAGVRPPPSLAHPNNRTSSTATASSGTKKVGGNGVGKGNSNSSAAQPRRALLQMPAGPPSYARGDRLNNNCVRCNIKCTAGNTDTGDRLFYCDNCWEARLETAADRHHHSRASAVGTASEGIETWRAATEPQQQKIPPAVLAALSPEEAEVFRQLVAARTVASQRAEADRSVQQPKEGPVPQRTLQRSHTRGDRRNLNCAGCPSKCTAGHVDTGDYRFYCDACWGLPAAAAKGNSRSAREATSSSSQAEAKASARGQPAGSSAGGSKSPSNEGGEASCK